MLKIGIIGYGYWGPNLARNFDRCEGAEVYAIAERDHDRLHLAKTSFKNIKYYDDGDRLITDPDIDAVVIASRADTHYRLCMHALEAGKHVFITKPFVLNSDDAQRVSEFALSKNKILMVDHTYLFTGAVQKLKQLIQDGSLGKLYYFDSSRVNLGIFQHDSNVIWDLAVHDLSIIDYIFSERPVEISATGIDHLESGFADTAYLTLYFPGNFTSHIHVSWLSPVKLRRAILAGSNNMIVWDDLNPEEKIKIYDRGVKLDNKEGIYQALASYRTGDIVSPIISNQEALSREVKYFIQCVENKDQPFNGGASATRIVRLLEAACISMDQRGVPVKI